MLEITWLCPEAAKLHYLRESKMILKGKIHPGMGPPGASIVAYESPDESGMVRYWYIFNAPGLLDGIGAMDHIQPGYECRMVAPASIRAGEPTTDAKPLKSVRKIARAWVRYQFRAHLEWRRKRRAHVLSRLGRFIEWLREDVLWWY